MRYENNTVKELKLAYIGGGSRGWAWTLLNEKANVTFRLYENLNHAFVPSVYGSIAKARKEYGIEQHIGENVISDLAGWILNASV